MATRTDSTPANQSAEAEILDVVVVGAGFSGLHLLYRFRELGVSVRVLEAADDVGGTWYWNRYPGARCDVQSIDYSYSFDSELDAEWQWSEKYATQPEILRYVQHVADRHDLRRDIEFTTRVGGARWDDSAALWHIDTEDGRQFLSRYYVMATGCLSVPKEPEIEGVERFKGEVLFTGRWPHDEVDLTGKRVGVIGTGSSAIQSIPLMAEQAASLTVFQRTPNFSLPAHNGPVPEAKLQAASEDRAAYREQARWSRGGVPGARAEKGTFDFTVEEREELMEQAWQVGELFAFGRAFNDLLTNADANEVASEFVRNKIRSIVNDPETAEALCPTTFPFGTKRPCLDTGYYETFNLDHVELIDINRNAITEIFETGIVTESCSFDVDVIVFATGFDAMTGAIVSVDIKGRDGVTLKDEWADGPRTYLGLMVPGFPNFFTVTGPGSPSVLSNMMVSIEQHGDWIASCIRDLAADGLSVIEPTETAEAGWGLHVNDIANLTLYPRANSWYMGANVPGKAQVFLPYIGGVDAYRRICDEVVDQDYLGFTRRSIDGKTVQCNDGVIRRLQPDVAAVLDLVASLELPPMESMTAEEARAFSAASAEGRPPGPDVGEEIDGEYPGAAGPLRYRLYRPPTPGPHPLTVYFHGGGWVLGGHDTDGSYCRDICVRSNTIVLSMDYRHAPEHRFPAAPEDGVAAVRWAASNAEALGAIPGQLAVSGWSAGANIAAVVCQVLATDDGPTILGQTLINPATDGSMAHASHVENADGYILTAALMRWFWDHYADPADRSDPRASPLRATDLAGLPPALVVTSEFDPLRDEGAAYAEAMSAAGVPAQHLEARGHTHTSILSVDIVISGAPIRDRIGSAMRSFLAAGVTA